MSSRPQNYDIFESKSSRGESKGSCRDPVEVRDEFSPRVVEADSPLQLEHIIGFTGRNMVSVNYSDNLFVKSMVCFTRN